MSGARLPMRKLRDVLRLTAAGMSSRQVAASLTVGATTVIDYLGRARRAGIAWPLRPANYTRRGILYARKGNLDAAFADYNKALERTRSACASPSEFVPSHPQTRALLDRNLTEVLATRKPRLL